jgi:hypothetical protein
MSNFKTIHANSHKFSFSKNDVNAIELGVSLTNRNLYKDNSKAYGRFSNFGGETYEGLNYKQHNDSFFEAVKTAAYEKANLIPENTSFALAFSFDTFQKSFFSVIQETIDNVNSKNEIEEILGFADVRSLAEGDSMNVTVKPTNSYFFERSGLGKTHGTAQKYYGKSVVLAPQTNDTEISFNRADIVAGRVDWGREISRAVGGLRSGYLQDIANLIFSSTVTSPIGNKTISTGAYSELDFRTKLQLIQAQNGSSNTYIYGTDISLSPLLPTNSQLQLGLGIEYTQNGFISTPFGTRAIALPQALLADNATLILPNNYVVGMSVDIGSKPVAIGVSGETRIQSQVDSENAGEDFVYTVKSDWDVKFAGQGRILLYKTM